ncbi:hypothetical protein GW756_02925 [bacterium]|nr:hypothetical protein [bacterium]NCQ55529.1 hypothetical protein [Candidatus Parcubacteria bacterium]NCS67540.1 hypothetical protein [Candidatus Peregrinibacteria bacterium]NCS96295.1 hypothetical protein [bacterium]
MTFTLTKSLTFSQAGNILLAKAERAQRACYTKLMKKVKAIAKKPLVKLLFKVNEGLEKGLKKIMQALHFIEKTSFFRLSGLLTSLLVKTVKQDGLKLTILLTSLGYTAWCYFI